MVAPTRFRFKAEYVLDKFGNPEEDSSRRSFGYIPSYHKRQWDGSPYRVPNEYICSRLGEFIGLPIPPCVITYNEILASPCIFSMLNFNVDKHELPPIEPRLFVKHMPRESSGILMFDIWIANSDRHDENLTVDDLERPSVVQVFDHDQALFGGDKNKGCDRMSQLVLRLGITGGPVTGNNEHCLLGVIDSAEYFAEWINAICRVPDAAIERLFRDVLQLKLINAEEHDAGVDFIKTRRGLLQSIIESHHADFPNITNWNPHGGLFQ